MTVKVHCLWACKIRQLPWKQSGSSSMKKQESSRKTFASTLLTRPKPLTMWITANWKILKEMGIPDNLTCLLRNLYAGQEATVRTGHGPTDWFQIGKRVCQGCILSPYLFHLYVENIMWNARLDEAQVGIKIARRNISNLRYADDTIFMAEGEEVKSLLMKVKEENEKPGLKLFWRKVRSWHLVLSLHGTLMGKQWKQWETIFLGLQNHCRWWLQPWN